MQSSQDQPKDFLNRILSPFDLFCKEAHCNEHVPTKLNRVKMTKKFEPIWANQTSFSLPVR